MSEKRVLIADDEPISRMIAEKILEKAGYRVSLAENGEEAVAVFREQKGNFDLVLLDLSMPKMDGTEAAREIRKMDSAVLIYGVTGDLFVGSEKLTEAGMNGCLEKPLSMEEVIKLTEEKKGFCGKNLNPHFVLNTLGVIDYLMEEDTQKARELLEDFISFTKTTLRWEAKQEWNTLREEIAYLKTYEKIMKVRFEDKFSVELEWERKGETALWEACGKDKLPFFTCKRLLETCFYDGIRDMDFGGKIGFRIYEEKGNRFLEVSQNGKAFSLEDNTILQEVKSAFTKEAFTSNSLTNFQEKFLEESSEKEKGAPGGCSQNNTAKIMVEPNKVVICL